MTNFKPSELPGDTLIKDDAQGYWLKDKTGLWIELSPHCIDCARTVTDAGRDEVSYIDNLSIKADDFFLNFKILSVPFTMFEDVVELFMSGDIQSPQGFIKEAFSTTLTSQTTRTPEEERKRQKEAIDKVSKDYTAEKIIESLIDVIEGFERTEFGTSNRQIILQNAIEASKSDLKWPKAEEEVVWKELHSFEYILIEVNERGQFRCNGQIFDPVFSEEYKDWTAFVVDGDGGTHPLSPKWFVTQKFGKVWEPNA